MVLKKTYKIKYESKKVSQKMIEYLILQFIKMYSFDNNTLTINSNYTFIYLQRNDKLEDFSTKVSEIIEFIKSHDVNTVIFTSLNSFNNKGRITDDLVNLLNTLHINTKIYIPLVYNHYISEEILEYKYKYIEGRLYGTYDPIIDQSYSFVFFKLMIARVIVV